MKRDISTNVNLITEAPPNKSVQKWQVAIASFVLNGITIRQATYHL